MRSPAVYGASKMNEAETWKHLRSICPDINWTARWPDYEGVIPPTPKNARRFWLNDFADIAKADFVLVLPPSEGSLRGALVEAGIGLALHKHIVLVGDCQDYGSWQHHPQVSKFSDIQSAIEFIRGAWEYEPTKS